MSSIDICISFDTTGSMYPCIGEVKRNVGELINRLFLEIPNIRLSLIAHGDYEDERETYLMRQVDFTKEKKKLVKFIKEKATATCGFDHEESYEYVLHKAKDLSWDSDETRILIMIGDAPPHPKDKSKMKLDWRKECKELYSDYGVNCIAVQCLDRQYAPSTTFYSQLAKLTKGYYLRLDQFSYVREMILAVCFKQVGNARVEQYEQEVRDRMGGGLTTGMRKIFDRMLNREEVVDDEVVVDDSDEEDEGGPAIVACPPAKFQILGVENKCSIKDFVEEMGLIFKKGKGFYEFNKPELISKKKEIVLMKTDTGAIYEGDGARRLAKLVEYDPKKRIKPSDIEGYKVFIQSTSYNRKLVGGTQFLFEVDDWLIE